jgi:S1-C subfamily serine protease
MDKESVASSGVVRRGVSLAVLIIAVLVTAAIVSGAFWVQRKFTATVTAQSVPVVTPVTGVVGKPSGAIAATSVGVPGAATSAPVPAPVNLTNEEIFRLKAPSVVLLQVFDEHGQITKTGSGFLAGPDETVITNYHMIRGAYSEKAVFQDGTTADVLGVSGYSSTDDLAAIRLSASPLGPLELGDSDRVEVGDRVIAIGSPRGFQNTISDGLVSGLRGGQIQTSAPISPGSSGGPFFNQQGQIIGVAVAGVTNAQNLNFVVPINLAKPYLAGATVTPLAELTAQNTVVRPLLNSSVTIAAGQNYELPIVIDENKMDNAEIAGKFQSSGGIGGGIRVYVKEQGTDRILYDSGRVTNGQFGLRLNSGVYRLVFDNSGSLVFPRTVAVGISLRFVR